MKNFFFKILMLTIKSLRFNKTKKSIHISNISIFHYLLKVSSIYIIRFKMSAKISIINTIRVGSSSFAARASSNAFARNKLVQARVSIIKI